MMLRDERILGITPIKGGVKHFIIAPSVSEVDIIHINFIEMEGNYTANW